MWVNLLLLLLLLPQQVVYLVLLYNYLQPLLPLQMVEWPLLRAEGLLPAETAQQEEGEKWHQDQFVHFEALLLKFAFSCSL